MLLLTYNIYIEYNSIILLVQVLRGEMYNTYLFLVRHLTDWMLMIGQQMGQDLKSVTILDLD